MKKKIIISIIVIAVIVCGGYVAYRVGMDLMFDRYLLKTALSSIGEVETEPESVVETEPESVVETTQGTTETTQEEGNIPALKQEEKPEKNDNVFEQHKKQAEELAKPKLTKTEIITRVMKSPELTNKMSTMIPSAEKRRVVQIVMSNFSAAEIAEIARTVSKGITKEYKSRMIAEARSRLTAAQWQECLGIAYKYIDQIRPYVE